MKNRKTENLPKISIVIPSYNKVAYIDYTLRSIIDQKYPNLEVIIQDGGSNDGSVEVIKQYAKKYPRIFVWESKKDGGQVDAINKGLAKTHGDIVTYINADDIYKEDALNLVAQTFLSDPTSLWIAGQGDIIDEKGVVIYSLVTKYKNLLLHFNQYSFLLSVNYLTQPSVFLDREAYFKYGPFTGTKRYVMEYELWIKLGKISMPRIIFKSLTSFRLTMDNISSTYFNELLTIDLNITKKFTKNWIILQLHYLHNLVRIFLISILKK